MRPKLLAAIALVLCLWQGAVAAQAMVNDLRFAQLEAELTFWGSERYMPTDVTRAQMDRGITSLTHGNPANADYHVLRATQQGWEAYWAPDAATRARYQQGAIQAYNQALQARPAHAQTAQLMLEYAQSIGDEATVRLAEHHVARLSSQLPSYN